jgi:hypothetical protein
MAYDPSKDVELKAWRIPTGLQEAAGAFMNKLGLKPNDLK